MSLNDNGTDMTLGRPVQGIDADWWRTAVVYQLYVRSFADSNGDGIGDLEGIRLRLPYLAELGVDAIWLNPCYPSPQADHGYDISDYFAIEPDYGDLADFDRMLADASALGIKIVMDVVPNHCSDHHEWFVAALAAGPGSAERDRFYFRDGRGAEGREPPNNWRSIFGGSAWRRIVEPDGTRGQWYLHLFAPEQPDLNGNNPDVRDHFDRMLRFWFDRGVAGFRADAVIHVGKAPGLPDDDMVDRRGGDAEVGGISTMFTWQPDAHDIWRRWRTVVDEYERDHPGRGLFLIAEADSGGDGEVLREYVNDKEFHQAFAFDLMKSTWHAPSMKRAIDLALDVMLPFGLAPAWTMNNHDAQRSVTRYGRSDAASYGENGMNNLDPSKASVDLVLGTRRACAAALLEMALPGSVYLYAGEELGLPEVLDLPDMARQDPVFFRSGGAQPGRDGCRVPIPWTQDPANLHGFSLVQTDTPGWLPQPADWGRWSVEDQTTDSSMLGRYRSAISARRRLTDLHSADFAWVDVGASDAIAFRRREVLVVTNLGDTDIQLDRSIVDDRRVAACSVAGHGAADVVPSNATVWLGRDEIG